MDELCGGRLSAAASPLIKTGTSVWESKPACVRSRRVAGLAAMKYRSSLIRSISGLYMFMGPMIAKN